MMLELVVGEGWWKLRRLNNNGMVGVGGEPQGTAGAEGGAAHSLEGDDVDAVGRGLEVDQVERTS